MAPASIESNPLNRWKRGVVDPERILAALSTSSYKALNSPRQTIDACIQFVAEAQKNSMSRPLRDWAADECAGIDPEALRDCFQIVLREAFRADLLAENLEILDALEREARLAFDA